MSRNRSYLHPSALYCGAVLVSTLVVTIACDSRAFGSDSLVAVGEVWRYFKGTTEPSQPLTAWRDVDFDDSTWLTGATGIGFGDGDDATVLNDMQNSYLSVYLRKSFNITNPGSITDVEFTVDYDDGFVAYLNGTEIGRRGLQGNPVPFDTAAISHEAGVPVSFPVSPALVRAGTNVLALQVHNVSVQSSDFSAIPSLVCDSGDVFGGYIAGGVLSAKRNALVRVPLMGSSSFDLSAFAAVVTFDSSVLARVGESFSASVWNDADFRSIDVQTPGIMRVGVIEDTTNSGNFVPRGTDQEFVSMTLQAGSCTGQTSIGFGLLPGDNVLVDTNAIGFDVTAANLVSGSVSIVSDDTFVRGNANGSAVDFAAGPDAAQATVTLADASFILFNIFGDGPPPPCMDAADADNNGTFDIADSVAVLSYLFNNSADAMIPEPFMGIGEDSGTSLGCITPPDSAGCQ